MSDDNPQWFAANHKPPLVVPNAKPQGARRNYKQEMERVRLYLPSFQVRPMAWNTHRPTSHWECPGTRVRLEFVSGRHWKLDQVTAVGDPTHLVQLGAGHRVSAGEGLEIDQQAR